MDPHLMEAKRQMKGVILAGGKGTRMYPLTLHTNKALLPVGDKPLIAYPIELMRDSGIAEICIVARSEHATQFVRSLGNGEAYGVDITYRFQDEARGIADALKLARRWVGDSPFAVMLGDTILEKSFGPEIDQFLDEFESSIFITEIEDPSWCGVVELDEAGRPVAIEEKPANPKSNDVAIGLYLYDRRAWEYLDRLVPSARGELEITDLNNCYIADGLLNAKRLRGWWIDAGTDMAAYYEAIDKVRGIPS